VGIEIERKFLILNPEALLLGDGTAIDQGYLSDESPTVRIRTMGTRAFLTIKNRLPSAAGEAIKAQEFEYEVPHEDAMAMLEFARARLTKTRYYLDGGLEVDVFAGRHAGLVIAEFESPDGAQPGSPKGIRWIEVTDDRLYSNSWMARFGVPPRTDHN
jgi:adenylate cyclase